MSKLSVYHDGEAELWVVAESKEHAFELLRDGGYYDGFESIADDFVQLEDDKELTIIEGTDAVTVAECGRITKTCREWCESNGSGFLCSLDW